MELLFESRLNLALESGKLLWIQQQPELHTDPVLRGDSFVDGAGASIYGSVLEDNGLLRMWYQAWPKDWDGSDAALVGYAESDDGLTWRKPALGLRECGPDSNNLTDLGFHSPAVFIDPQAPASHRYQATGYASGAKKGAFAGLDRAGYFTAHSADGLHWELDAPAPAWDGADVITSHYHPGRHAAQVALKRSPRFRAMPRRAIWTAEVRDDTCSDAHRALVPDDFDDVCAVARGFASSDYYGMGMQAAGEATVGFIWQFRHNLPRTAGEGPRAQFGVFGVVGVTLAYQEEAHAVWQHAPGRLDFVPHNALPWAEGGVYTSASPVAVQDEHRLYLCGFRRTHCWSRGADWKLNEKYKALRMQNGLAAITFARWPKWRLFGFRSDPEGVLSIDLGTLTKPKQLILNYECEPEGSIRVEQVDCEQHALDNAVPLTGNELEAPVAWQNSTTLTPTDNPCRMRLHLDRAAVWAYALR